MAILYGNAVVGQSGGPTAAINATLAGVIRGYLDKDSHGGAIGTLYGMRNGVEGLLEERLIDLSAYFDTEEKLGLVRRFQTSQERFDFIIGRLEEISEKTGIDFSDIIAAAKDITV